MCLGCRTIFLVGPMPGGKRGSSGHPVRAGQSLATAFVGRSATDITAKVQEAIVRASEREFHLGRQE
jgi:hypothetical protein